MAKTTAPNPNMARLKAEHKQFSKELMKELGLKNPHQLPELQKIVVNIGLGRAKDDKKLIEVAANTLKKVTGQVPIETVAKKSIAGFKLREGNKIGLKVTLRGDRMYEFMDRFINIVLPRMRDFHGVNNKSFDKSGNFAVGLTDQSVFPELTFEETTNAHGLQVIFVVDSHEPAHSRALLVRYGMPFEKTADELAKARKPSSESKKSSSTTSSPDAPKETTKAEQVPTESAKEEQEEPVILPNANEETK